MSPEQKKTEEKIIDAAEEVFIKEGFYGTRTQKIADKAGINKALVHYYFRSKQKLFYAVFQKIAPTIFSSIFKVLQEDISLFEKIRKFVSSYIDKITTKNKNIPLFIISELERNPKIIADTLDQTFNELGVDPVETFKCSVEKEIKAGIITPIDHRQLFVNMVSMCIFPFIGRPIIMKVGKFDGQEYDAFLKERKKNVADFIINSIKK